MFGGKLLSHMIFALKPAILMLVVSQSPGWINLRVDANITPYEHTILVSLTSVFVFISACCWSFITTKKGTLFCRNTQGYCCSPTVRLLFCSRFLHICQPAVVLVCVCVCEHTFCLCGVLMRNTNMTAVSGVMTVWKVSLFKQICVCVFAFLLACVRVSFARVYMRVHECISMCVCVCVLSFICHL